MRRIVAIGAIAALVAGCGGGGSEKPSKAPATPAPSSKGGVVTAEPTKGLLLPPIGVENGKVVITGKGGPISPKENRPTDAQRNGVAGAGACASTSANPAPSNLGALQGSILCLLNAERSAKGLSALHSNGKLRNAAKAWANRMVAGRFFAHEAGNSTVLSRIKRTGYVRGNWSLGENIAWGSGALATPQAIVNGWMHSPGHRANILHGAFKDIGIGIKLGAPGQGLSGGATYVTDFGKHS
ncbi:MAG TPA: CAP domain-containing protein [Thermoleophilaceae bacterium]